jgi:hypothetical protein
LADVFEEKISLDHARVAYGVIIAGDPPEIDAIATAALRAMRSTTRSR